jgi:hypothetical protein
MLGNGVDVAKPPLEGRCLVERRAAAERVAGVNRPLSRERNPDDRLAPLDGPSIGMGFAGFGATPMTGGL